MPASEALPSPWHAVPLHLRVPCPLLCLPSVVAPWAGLLSLSPAVPAEAGAEASGCPGTADAAKAPLNRAEQEGALGRRPGAEEGSPRQCPHCPHIPRSEPCSDLAGSGGHLESLWCSHEMRRIHPERHCREAERRQEQLTISSSLTWSCERCGHTF